MTSCAKGLRYNVALSLLSSSFSVFIHEKNSCDMIRSQRSVSSNKHVGVVAPQGCGFTYQAYISTLGTQHSILLGQYRALRTGGEETTAP